MKLNLMMTAALLLAASALAHASEIQGGASVDFLGAGTKFIVKKSFTVPTRAVLHELPAVETQCLGGESGAVSCKVRCTLVMNGDNAVPLRFASEKSLTLKRVRWYYGSLAIALETDDKTVKEIQCTKSIDEATLEGLNWEDRMFKIKEVQDALHDSFRILPVTPDEA